MNGYDLGFSDIYGAGTGDTGAAQDIMKQLFNLLKQSGRSEFKDYDWMAGNAFGGLGQSRGYDLQGWESYLGGEHFQEGGGASEQGQKMASTLLSMLQGSGVMDLTKGYGQDIGDIGSEFGAQLKGLQKGYGAQTKGGRYGKIGAGGRNTGGGGRNKYMSDIYGLEQKQHEMQQGLQDQFSSDFYSNLATWQGLNPSPYIGDEE
tara:strand:+ start:2629 stop:3240 length:612 start_codon:yes stop_codon:yes gene_type:complete